MLSVVILFILIVIGSVIYANWLSIGHQNEQFVIKSFGQCEYMYDSIVIDLTVDIPSFDSCSISTSEIICFTNHHFYSLKSRSGNIHTLLEHNEEYKWLDSLFLSKEEISSIQNTYSNTIPDDLLGSFKGALLFESYYCDKVTMPRKAKQIKESIQKEAPTTGKNYLFASKIDLPSQYLIDTNQWELVSTNRHRDSSYVIEKEMSFGGKCHKNYLLWEATFPGNEFFIYARNYKPYKRIHKYDLSQEVINLSLVCNSNNNDFIKIRKIAIPFEAYPDFTYLFPKPDSIGEKVIFYTDTIKIDQIKSEGFHAFVKYPEKQSLQTARIFILTMVLSLLLTGLINQSLKLIKEQKVKRKFGGKTERCAISVIDCNDCPLRAQCKHFKED